MTAEISYFRAELFNCDYQGRKCQSHEIAFTWYNQDQSNKILEQRMQDRDLSRWTIDFSSQLTTYLFERFFSWTINGKPLTGIVFESILPHNYFKILKIKAQSWKIHIKVHLLLFYMTKRPGHYENWNGSFWRALICGAGGEWRK